MATVVEVRLTHTMEATPFPRLPFRRLAPPLHLLLGIIVQQFFLVLVDDSAGIISESADVKNRRRGWND